MRPRDLAPDDSDLGSSDLLLAAVDVCDALAQVEGSGFRVVDALDLDERRARVGVSLAALVREVLAPAREEPVSIYPPQIAGCGLMLEFGFSAARVRDVLHV